MHNHQFRIDGCHTSDRESSMKFQFSLFRSIFFPIFEARQLSYVGLYLGIDCLAGLKVGTQWGVKAAVLTYILWITFYCLLRWAPAQLTLPVRCYHALTAAMNASSQFIPTGREEWAPVKFQSKVWNHEKVTIAKGDEITVRGRLRDLEWIMWKLRSDNGAED
jgi:hypothetical protein